MSTAAPIRPALGPMTPVLHQVAWRRRELADTVTLGLVPVNDGIAVPGPGQFTMLWVPGVGEAPISLSGLPDPGDPNGSLEHTIRAVGPVTRALVATEVGDIVGVRGPMGAGWDLRAAEGHDVMIVAGGLGLAPLRPVVLAVLAQRHRFGRVALLVGARTPSVLLFTDDLERWRGRFDLDVEVTVDAVEPGWHGDVGVVTRLVGRIPVDVANTVGFVCGPEVMMRFAAAALVERGVPASTVQVSLERNMQCGVGHCGHCQLGPLFVCTDGPVVTYPRVEQLFTIRER